MKNNQRKKLPIGIQTFAKIREADYYYVDTRAHVLNLGIEFYEHRIVDVTTSLTPTGVDA